MSSKGVPSVKSSHDYLSAIAGAVEEKSEVTRYLEQIGNGTVLEIGPGGGEALQRILDFLASETDRVHRPKIVVLDIEQRILEKVRAALGDSVEYVQADASKTLPFATGSVNAINASSVLHECFSYGGGFKALNVFAKECGRILATDGVLVYRDLDGVELMGTTEVELKSPLAKGFFLFFIGKFLDKQWTRHAKVELGYEDDLVVLVGEKKCTLKEVLSMDPDEVTKQNVRIQAKNGLIKEFERHFMLFCKNILPEASSIVHAASDSEVDVSFATKEARQFLESLGMPGPTRDKRYVFSPSQWNQISEAAKAKASFLEEPVSIEIQDVNACNEVVTMLLQQNINFKRPNENCIILTLSDCNMVYESVSKVALKHGGDIKVPESVRKACEWGISEGEEHYYYGPPEEVIARFSKFSLVEDPNSSLGYSCLCPLSPDHNRSSVRPDYTAFLRENLSRKDGEINDQKRHIHFAKMPIEKALPVLIQIYSTTRNPVLFEVLSALLCIMRNFLSSEGVMHAQKTGHLVLPPGMDGYISLCEQLVVNTGIHAGIEPVHFSSKDRIGVVGGIASGKTTVSNVLIDHGYGVISLSNFVREELIRRGITAANRNDYFEAANAMRRTHGKDILERLAVEKIARDGIRRFVIDGMRTPEGVDYLRKVFHDLLIIGVETPMEERIRRVMSRLRDIDPTSREAIQYDIAREWSDVPEGCQLGKVMEKCNVFVNGGLPIATNLPQILDITGIPH